MISIMCYQCKAEAIVKDEQTGIVRILADRRKGSRDCIEACPYGLIQLDAVATRPTSAICAGNGCVWAKSPSAPRYA